MGTFHYQFKTAIDRSVSLIGP